MLVMHSSSQTIADDNGIIYSLNNDGTATIYKFSSRTPKNVTISVPSTINYSGLKFIVDKVGFGNYRRLNNGGYRSDGSVFTFSGYSSEYYNNNDIYDVVLPNTIKIISDFAFANKRYTEGYSGYLADGFYKANLGKINFPEGLDSIGMYAFYYTDISEAIFPTTLRAIGEGAFRCSDVTKVVFPKKLKYIDSDAFYACPVNTIIYLSPNPPSGFFTSGKTYVPDKVNYQKHTNYALIPMVTWESLDNDTIQYTGRPLQIPAYTNHVEGYEIELHDEGITLENKVGNWLKYIPATLTNGNEKFDTEIALRYTIAPIPINVGVQAVEREYGDENPTFKLIYKGVLSDADVSTLEKNITVTTNATKTSPVGNYAIKVSGDTVIGNYKITYEPGTLLVKKASLTGKVRDVQRKYGNYNPRFSVECTGLKNGETEPEWSKEPTFTTTAGKTSPVGDYSITATNFEARNYNLSSITPGRLTITPELLTAKANDASRFYYEENPELTYTIGGFVNGETEAVLQQKPKVSTNAILASDAGEYPITVSEGKAQNYTFEYEDGALSVLKRSLTVTTPNYSRTYGESNPKIEMDYSGFVNNENESVLQSKPVASVDATKTSDTGVYPIWLTGGNAKNYDFIYRPGKLTVNKADQTLKWEQDLSKVEVGDQVELKAEASSGLPVEYIIPQNSFVMLYNAGDRNFLDCFGEGELVIRALQGGNQNYNASVRLSKILKVSTTTGINQAWKDEGISVSLVEHTIVVRGKANNEYVHVYTPDGRKVYEGKDDRIELLSGIYIIRVGTFQTKMLVK